MRETSSGRPRYTAAIPLTPLIDIVFLLLVYFLLTTNFMVDEGISVKLPQAAEAEPRNPNEITVTVDPGGRVFLEDREIPLEDLTGRLRERIGLEIDPLLVVRADREVVLDIPVRVMDAARKAGAGRLCLATERPEGGGK